MPEGLEVFMLGDVLRYLDIDVKTHGKHLLYRDTAGRCYDITFGLVGKINLLKTSEGYDIQKLTNTALSGDIRHIPDFESIVDNLGVDWVSGTREQMLEVVKKWSDRPKKIAALLIDQHEISGIGVAWGSEILHHASIHPTTLANTVDMDVLVDAMVEIRDHGIAMYMNISIGDPEYFANRWFGNLYNVRKMEVYKVGKEVNVAGRKWWTML